MEDVIMILYEHMKLSYSHYCTLPSVFIQIILSAEELFADIACEHLLSRMGYDVTQ